MGPQIAPAALMTLALLSGGPTYAAVPTVTVTQVLSDGPLYDGKQVRLHGFVTLEFENNRVWRDEAAFRNYEPDNAIRVSAPNLPQSKRNEVKGHLAFLTGKLEVKSDPGGYVTSSIDVADIERDPEDRGPDRGWWSDPEIGRLLAILAPLAIVASFLGLALWSRGSARTEWRPTRTPRALGTTRRIQRR